MTLAPRAERFSATAPAHGVALIKVMSWATIFIEAGTVESRRDGPSGREKRGPGDCSTEQPGFQLRPRTGDKSGGD